MRKSIMSRLDRAQVSYTTHEDSVTFWVHVKKGDDTFSFQTEKYGTKHKLLHWRKGGLGGSFLVEKETINRANVAGVVERVVEMVHGW